MVKRGQNQNPDVRYYYPFCELFDCGGQKDGPRKCSQVEQNKITIPAHDEFLHVKTEARKALKAKRAREARAAKKRRMEQQQTSY